MRATPLLLLSVGGLCAGAASAEPAQPAPDAMAQQMLDALVATSGVPGFGAAVTKDGKVIWSGSAGKRDMEQGLPVTTDTRFRLASVSKLLAATAAAKLAELGALDLDAPVATLLPEAGKAWPAITVRQLAAHIAGMPHYQPQDTGRGGVRYASSRDALKIFAGRPLLQPPGQAYSYSSWGYTLIGAAVEHASGKHFVDYVKDDIAPGLTIDSDFTGRDPMASVAYDFADGTARPAPAHDFSYTWAGGGMGATPAALATFGARVLRGAVVSAKTREMMFTPARLNDGKPVSESDYQIGLGWRVARDQDGRRMAFHNGIAVGARSALVLFRDEGMTASLLSNALWTSSIDRTAQMLAAPFRAPPPLVAAACPIKATRYSGTFGDKPVSGRVTFRMEQGLCTGTLENAGALTEFFGNGPQPGTAPLRVIGLAADGSLPRGGLVTPYGIYDWRAAGPNRFAARFGPTRELAVALD